jgi:hypothetical protein
MNLFVYYKLILADYPDVRSKIKTLQTALVAKFPGLHCDLMKRPDTDASGNETWMEIYTLGEIDLNAFRDTLDRLAMEQGLSMPRRNEIFTPI